MSQAREKRRLPPSKRPKLGDRVRGKYQGQIGGRNWFNGVVTTVHEDGTCDLHYDDGDHEERVAPRFIKTIAKEETEEPAEPDDHAVLLALATREDNDTTRLRAGEALSHLMLTATAMGLASCPLTDPLNDMRSRLGLACEVFDGEAYPQALIRLGLPPAEDVSHPPSTRRPVSETTTWSA
jgi:nitroreductase